MFQGQRQNIEGCSHLCRCWCFTNSKNSPSSSDLHPRDFCCRLVTISLFLQSLHLLCRSVSSDTLLQRQKVCVKEQSSISQRDAFCSSQSMWDIPSSLPILWLYVPSSIPLKLPLLKYLDAAPLFLPARWDAFAQLCRERESKCCWMDSSPVLAARI